MRASELFLISFASLFIMNMLLPSFDMGHFAIGIITGFLVSLLITGVISSIQILGSGLNASGTWLIFALSVLLSMLFGVKIDIAKVGTIQIGGNLLGSVFTYQYPLIVQIIVTTIGIITILSFLLIVIGGARGS